MCLTVNRRQYVAWMIDYAHPELTAFWKRLADEVHDRVTAHTEVSLLQGLTKDDLRAVLNKHYTPQKLLESITTMQSRLKRHMPLSPLLCQEVFHLIRSEFLVQAAKFESNVASCYGHERVPTRYMIQTRKIYD